MNDKKKKNRESANKAAEKLAAAQSSVMEELDDDALDTVTGAGNPWANTPRVPESEIPDESRGNM